MKAASNELSGPTMKSLPAVMLVGESLVRRKFIFARDLFDQDVQAKIAYFQDFSCGIGRNKRRAAVWQSTARRSAERRIVSPVDTQADRGSRKCSDPGRTRTSFKWPRQSTEVTLRRSTALTFGAVVPRGPPD